MTNRIPGSPDFFSVYVMSYCEGVTEECKTEGTNETNIVTTIRSCSDRNVLFTFNPTDALSQAMEQPPGDAWPSYLSDDFEAMAPTSRTMAVFYVIGTSMAGLALLVKLFSIWNGRPSNSSSDTAPSSMLFLVLLTSLLSMGIASVVGSVLSSQLVGLINQSGAPLGIYADHGSAFLGMSWTASALQLIGTLDHLVVMLIYRAQHCRCDWRDEAEKPLNPDDES